MAALEEIRLEPFSFTNGCPLRITLESHSVLEEKADFPRNLPQPSPGVQSKQQEVSVGSAVTVFLESGLWCSS